MLGKDRKCEKNKALAIFIALPFETVDHNSWVRVTLFLQHNFPWSYIRDWEWHKKYFTTADNMKK